MGDSGGGRSAAGSRPPSPAAEGADLAEQLLLTLEASGQSTRVEFAFEPKSYRLGWWVSAFSAGAVLAFAVSIVAGNRRGKKLGEIRTVYLTNV